MNETVRALLEKAHQALRAPRLLLKANDAEGCINRAYYAAFHAATAALILVGESPRTHKEAHRHFWVLFVETGQMPASLGGLLSHAQKVWERAVYDAFSSFDTAAAADLLSDMDTFVEAVEALIHVIEERSM